MFSVSMVRGLGLVVVWVVCFSVCMLVWCESVLGRFGGCMFMGCFL